MELTQQVEDRLGAMRALGLSEKGAQQVVKGWLKESCDLDVDRLLELGVQDDFEKETTEAQSESGFSLQAQSEYLNPLELARTAGISSQTLMASLCMAGLCRKEGGLWKLTEKGAFVGRYNPGRTKRTQWKREALDQIQVEWLG